MRAIRIAALVAACGLSACVAPTTPPSYVSLDGTSDANAVAYTVVQFVAQKMPSGDQRVAVYPAPGGADVLVQPIVSGLQKQGIGIAFGKDSHAPGVHQLTYWVDQLNHGQLIRIWLDGQEAAQLLTRGETGYLRPSGPFTIRTEGAPA